MGAAPVRAAGLAETGGADRADGGTGRRSLRRAWPLLAVLALVAVWTFVAEPLRVTSVSMEPGLRAGEHVLVDKLTYRTRRPRRDELIVFPQPGDGQLAVKRVVGLPGDSVALEDGVLVVNDAVRHESYVDHRTVDSVYFGPKIIPPGTVFVMGDNRGPSIDSRDYGPVAVDSIVGRVIWNS